MSFVKFEEYNNKIEDKTSEDFGLGFLKAEIGTPEVKRYTVSVPGRDGDPDLTEALGGVHFGNRTITLYFDREDRGFADSLDGYEKLVNFLHGRKFKISFSDDPEYYYVGRASLSYAKETYAESSYTVDLICEPYKYRKILTEVNVPANTDGEVITLHNGRMPVNPTFSNSAPTRVEFGDVSISIGAGVYVLTAVQLDEGDNTMKVYSTESSTITYREGLI